MQHSMEKPVFTHLRPLRLAIAAALLAPCLPALANGLAAANTPGALPIIGEHQGVPVIDIVAPNADGLSHNRFNEFNVGGQGLVLNNSLNAGHSELAGALPANAQFDGTAARVILNEVVGHNRSNINGPQAIFGSAADYVLANPNGIMLNGATLDNAARASFVVGSATLVDGQLSQFDTQGAKGQLRVDQGGVSNDGGGLALIAPSIATHGQVRSAGNLDLIMGNNRVDYASTTVAQSGRLPKRIDANLLGAMAAGNRINIVSSEAGAGIKMPGSQLTAGQGIRITSAGDINLATASRTGKPSAPTQLQGGAGALHLEAARQLNLAGAQLETTANVRLTADSVRSQGAKVVSGDTLHLGADSVTHSSGTRLQGSDVNVDVRGKLADAGTHYASTMGKIRINADSHEMKASMLKAAAGAATTSTAQVGSLTAAQGIEVRLGGNGRYEGTRISTAQGPIDMKTGGNLVLTQATDIVERHTKAGPSVERTAVVGQLSTPGAVKLHAGRDVQLNAVNIGSAEHKVGSLTVTAQGSLTSLAAINRSSIKGGGESDIAGGLYQLSQTDEQSQTQLGNRWYVNEAMTLQAGARKPQAIHLQGVEAEAASITLDANAGGMLLEAASSQKQLDSKQLSATASDAQAPGVALTHRREDSQSHRNTRLQASSVTLDSAADVRVDGARIEAATLAGDIRGKLSVAHRTDSLQSLKVTGSAQPIAGAPLKGLLGEMSTLAGKWNKPAQQSLDALPAAGPTQVKQASFEFDRRSQTGGIAQASLAAGTQATTLKVAGGSTHAAHDASSSDLQTTHRITNEQGGLDTAKRLYEQVRIR